MSKRLDRRLVDTNSLVMGSGVGLATLEAMFNMVNTQSLLSANMVRDFELSHPVQLQALANALAQLMAAQEYGNYSDAIPVRIPPGKEQATTSRPGEESAQLGGLPNIDAMNRLLNKDGSSGDTTSTLNTTSMSGLDNAAVEKLLTELLTLFREHLSDMTKNSKPSLAVT